ncbi:dipeptidyl-peptidase 5 precursor, putative [Entamoeba histolytica HM-3:IMSS]|uniref:Dipeptidyl-peptidase 5, putative n=1 Tax=Entamoeba histolytica HM-3:IMSS TaxID=885315 RepID=M7VZB8_ENTHI|nr:dipeptidyl-peptidase 5 precursor, putative [Entamoeba histolytica HM-3:IMSS]
MISLLWLAIGIVSALTADDVLNKTSYVVAMTSDNNNYVYYIVKSVVNGIETNTLYQTSVQNEGKYFIELAQGVGNELYYSVAHHSIFYTKCDGICSLYSLDSNMQEYQVTKDIAVSLPVIIKEHLYFVSPIFFGMTVQDSLDLQKKLANRKQTSHHVFTQTPFGEGSSYVTTNDDGTPQYKHLISSAITVDENGRIIVGQYTDVSNEVGNVISYDISDDESIVVFEAKSTASASDKKNYLKSSIYTISVGSDQATCISCNYPGNQIEPKATKTGKYIVFMRTTNTLEKNPAKYFVLYDLEDGSYRADVTLNEFTTEKYLIGKHSNEETITVFVINNRREVLAVRKAVYSFESKAWNIEEVVVEGAVEMMAEVPCQDESSCLFIAQSFQYQPSEIYYCDEAMKLTKLTKLNDYTSYNLQKPILVNPMGSLHDRIQSLLYLPSNNEKAPILLVVHDEEEGTIVDGFNKIMNPYVYTNEGYAVVMINSHVSKGFGERMRVKGSNDINVIIEDIQAVINELEKYPVDTSKIAVVGVFGASKIITGLLDAKLPIVLAAVHAPILSIRSQYYTDAKYTLEYTFEGADYDNSYWYSHNDAMKNVASYNVPTLISYGDLDFVVDKSQPISLFQALQRRGIKSRLLRFPYSTNVLTKNEDIKVFYEQYIRWFNENMKN